MNTKWSSRLERTVAIRLPDDVARWFDDDIWKAIEGAGNRAELSDALHKYWRDSANLAESENRPRDAYQNYYLVGWDLYVYDDMEVVLECLGRNARSAGGEPLARIAERHLRALQAL